jgi:hypothetical protein
VRVLATQSHFDILATALTKTVHLFYKCTVLVRVLAIQSHFDILATAVTKILHLFYKCRILVRVLAIQSHFDILATALTKNRTLVKQAYGFSESFSYTVSF